MVGNIALQPPIHAICFDWGGTLMSNDGPDGVPMCYWRRIAVVPGARECLEALQGFSRLCVATNAADSSRALIERALDRVGLLALISDVFCFKELGCGKAQPEYWAAVLERLGLPPSHVVMVGDSLEHDVLAPRRSGLQSLWFNEDGARSDPPMDVSTITCLRDLTRLVVAAAERE